MLGKRKQPGGSGAQLTKKRWQDEIDEEDDEIEAKMLEGELSDAEIRQLMQGGEPDEEGEAEYRKRRKLEEER